MSQHEAKRSAAGMHLWQAQLGTNAGGQVLLWVATHTNLLEAAAERVRGLMDAGERFAGMSVTAIQYRGQIDA